MPCIKKISRIDETNITAIVAVHDFYGVINCLFVKGGVNANTFLLFIAQTLKKIQEDRSSASRSFSLVMDNVGIHSEVEIKKMIDKSQFKLLKTAIYSPELHCIEYVFSIWKGNIRIPSELKELDPILLNFFKTLNEITPAIIKSCKAYVESVIFPMVEQDVDLQLSSCSKRFRELFKFPVQAKLPDYNEVVDLDEREIGENEGTNGQQSNEEMEIEEI